VVNWVVSSVFLFGEFSQPGDQKKKKGMANSTKEYLKLKKKKAIYGTKKIKKPPE